MRNIIRFYDDNDKMRCTRPLYLITEDKKFGLEYCKLRKDDESKEKWRANQFGFDKYVFNETKYNKPDSIYVTSDSGNLYDNENNYIVAFDVLWDGLRDEHLEQLVKNILTQAQVKGVIVYTSMGTSGEASEQIKKLKKWLGDSNVSKVNEKFVKIGTTDPHSDVIDLKGLANEMLTENKNRK